ncbi:hypothetical protein MSAN_00891800 [Mycena sanguinolenta]|uniref:Uncharacterized protein n=1 Tax=Mycena sanguinolenta TaxID=230812 RepID=A0A8H6YU35_9AGAR|nr:hypothetical protein MSAN_00891800 [Mycena sanguinolenta]
MDPQNTNPTSPSNSAGTMPTMTPINSRTLTLTYSRPGEGGATHHAIIPFPERYEQAVADALKLLGKYMTNADPQAKDVVLKYSIMQKRDGKWIWAEFEPANWLLVVQPGAEIGMFEREVPRSLAVKEIFWRGPVYLAFGETNNSLTTWQGLDPTNRAEPSLYLIDRPVNYAEAVAATRNCVAGYNTRSAIKRVQEPGRTLTFYLFEDQRTVHNWIAIPPQATTDDNLWQALVPPPHALMGVIAN